MKGKNDFYTDLKKGFPHQPTKDQDQALRALSEFMFEARPEEIFLLKGYAGTGKTSLLKALTQSISNFGWRSAQMAPTGRAAKVMSNYSGRPAFTIHRSIYRLQAGRGGQLYFALRENKARNTLFIVDEASMIHDEYREGSSSLLSDLLEFVHSGYNCRLILVGDQAQLPPVGSEESPALSADYLLRHYQVKAKQIELKTVVRQEADSFILENATALRDLQAEPPFKNPVFDLGDDFFRLVSGFDAEDALQNAVSEVGKEEMAIIVRSNKRANLYNQQLRGRIMWQEDEISAGDLLMVVKNNYHWLKDLPGQEFIANGDILELMEIYELIDLYEHRFARVKIRFLDREDIQPFESILLLNVLNHPGPSFSFEDQAKLNRIIALDYQDMQSKAAQALALKNNPYANALQVKFAYALTAHKAQGGQWKRVFIEHPWRPEEEVTLDYLRWLYTAITRAQEKVYLLGFPDEYFGPDAPSF